MKSAGSFPPARNGLLAGKHGLLALLLVGHSFIANAADIHWANPVNGSWNTAANWTPAQVPGASDRAFITVSGSYTVAVSTVTSVVGLEVGGAAGTQVFTNTANVILNGAANVGANGVWNVSGGVAGTGEVSVSGRFGWYGGSMNRTGTVTIATGGVLQLAGGSKTFSNGRILLQPGAVGSWNAGALFSAPGLGAILENEGTFDINGDLTWNTDATDPPRFINRGVVRKTAGTAASARLLGLFENGVGGHLQVQAGAMEIHGSSVGRFTLDAGTTLIVATGGTSQNVFGAGTVFEGPGLLSVSGGISRLDPGSGFASPAPALRVQTGELHFNSGQPLTAQALTLISGRISGSDTVTVTDLATWQAGELAVGLTLVAAGGVDMTGTAARTLNGTLRLPQGSVSTWRAGSINSTAVGHLENFGTMTMLGDMDWTANAANPPSLINRGHWSKAGGALESSLAVIVNNGSAGVVQVSSGTLSFVVGGSCDGELQVETGATLKLSANGLIFEMAPNGRLSGPGRFLVSLGTFRSQPGADLSQFQGTLEIAGGTCQLSSAGSLAVDSLILGGGTLSGLENISVAGPTVWRGSTIAGSPTIEAWGGLYLTNSSPRSFQGGTIINRGFAQWTNGPIVGSAGPAVFSNAFGAQLEIGGPFSQSWTLSAGSSASFINSGTITVQTPVTRRLTLNVPFENRGDLFLMNSEVWMDVPGSFRQTAGRTIMAGATLRPFNIPLQLDGGELSGSGAILTTVNNNARVIVKDPGAPLTIIGTYVQSSQGVLDIDWAEPGAAFNQLVVSRGTIPSNGRALLDGLLQVSLADGFYPPARAQFPVLVCTNRTGTFSSFTYPSNEVGLAVSYSALGVTLDVINVRPVILPVVDPVIAEESSFTLQLEATDDDLPAQSLTWSLVEGPAGLSTSSTGLVTWTPREADGPGFFDVTVRVTDDGTPPLSMIRTFHIEVQEVNEAPVLTLPLPLAINEGSTLSVMATSSDTDVPENGATFALVSAPPGMTIDPRSGAISWTTTEADGPGEYSVAVRVTDFNSVAVNDQALGQTGSFSITVREVNAPPHLVVPAEITIEAGGMVSWLVTATDEDLPANTLAFEHLAGPGTVTLNGRFQWTPNNDHIGTTNRVEIRVTDNASPSLSETGILRIVVVSPPILARPEAVGSGWRLAWSAVPGRQYQLQAAADPSGGWIEIEAPVTATGTNASIELPEVLPPPARAAGGFFRVRVLP